MKKWLLYLISAFPLLTYAESSHCETIFTKYYADQVWGVGSGTGSDLEQTKIIRDAIPLILNQYDCRVMVDAPCGDFFWMTKVQLPLDQYIGVDVVKPVIEQNQIRYGNHVRQFFQLDLINQVIPKADIVLCRDCLVHLSYKDIAKVIKLFKQSGTKYLLTTHFPDHPINRNIATGSWRTLNFTQSPFYFPIPLEMINEGCSECNGVYNDKSLALWKIEDLPDLSYLLTWENDSTYHSAIYSQIKDIFHPTLEDYRLIQHYLHYGERPNIGLLTHHESTHYTDRARNFKIIGDLPHEIPVVDDVAINCSNEDKDNVILTYASFNNNYPRGLVRLVELIKQTDYRGHLLYRIGGWPNTEGGNLLSAHVPYGFKACFFKEAERLGYKRVLWMDSSFYPAVSLNKIFAHIKDNGYFFIDTNYIVGHYFNPFAAQTLEITMDEANQIRSCAAGLFGVDLTHPIGLEIMNRFYQATQDDKAYYSPRMEQNVLSVIIHKLGIFSPIEFDKIEYLFDRRFVHH